LVWDKPLETRIGLLPWRKSWTTSREMKCGN
jgi:hypothetical protein